MKKIVFALVICSSTLFMAGCCGFDTGCCGGETSAPVTNCCGTNNGW